MVSVISLGGSIVAPREPDTAFLSDFITLIREKLESDERKRFIIVTGGGGPARTWQNAYGKLVEPSDASAADWIGIMATRLNAQLLKALFGDLCTQEVVTNPTQLDPFVGRVLIAAGWKPGFSTDYDAVLLAERFQADCIINLSNIERVYTDDPRVNPAAKPIDTISWADFRKIVGEDWTPGKNAPFDPVASRHAAKIGLNVIFASGRDISNLHKLLDGDSFIGTRIG